MVLGRAYSLNSPRSLKGKTPRILDVRGQSVLFPDLVHGRTTAFPQLVACCWAGDARELTRGHRAGQQSGAAVGSPRAQTAQTRGLVHNRKDTLRSGGWEPKVKGPPGRAQVLQKAASSFLGPHMAKALRGVPDEGAAPQSSGSTPRPAPSPAVHGLAGVDVRTSALRPCSAAPGRA